MPIALQRATCPPLYESPEFAEAAGDDMVSCSSSIGRNSECYGGSDGGHESEVESRYKGPLDTMDALEDSLPMRRGISKFYCGKSKSFACLPDSLPSSSAKNLAKRENPYSRKRKNLLAFSLWENPNHNQNSKRSSNRDTAVSKRPTNSSRTTTQSNDSSSGSNSQSNGSSEEDDFPPQGKCFEICPSRQTKRFAFPMRSFSMADLSGVVCSTSSIKSGRM